MIFLALLLAGVSSTLAAGPCASDIPVIVLFSKLKGPIDVPRPEEGWFHRSAATMRVFENACINEDDPTYDGPAGIKLRGRSTLELTKKQYSVKLYNSSKPAGGREKRTKKNVPLLGMKADSHWVMNGPFIDQTYLRNHLGFMLARTGSADWQPDSRFFELFVVPDGETEVDVDKHFKGLYLMIEKIKASKNRLRISKMKPTDVEGRALTGGYIFARDAADRNDFVLKTDSGDLVVKYPKTDRIQNDQLSFLEGTMAEVDNMLARFNCSLRLHHSVCQRQGGLLDRPDSKLPLWTEFLDEDSFVDYFLHSEAVKNQDGYSTSRYYYKPRDSAKNAKKVHAGPVWDLNLAIGQVESKRKPEGWHYLDQHDYIYEKIATTPDFVARARLRYIRLRETGAPWETAALVAWLQKEKDRIGDSGAVTRDHIKWYGSRQATTKWHLFQTECDNLQEFLIARLEWLDANICSLGSDGDDVDSYGNADPNAARCESSGSGWFGSDNASPCPLGTLCICGTCVAAPELTRSIKVTKPKTGAAEWNTTQKLRVKWKSTGDIERVDILLMGNLSGTNESETMLKLATKNDGATTVAWPKTDAPDLSLLNDTDLMFWIMVQDHNDSNVSGSSAPFLLVAPEPEPTKKASKPAAKATLTTTRRPRRQPRGGAASRTKRLDRRRNQSPEARNESASAPGNAGLAASPSLSAPQSPSSSSVSSVSSAPPPQALAPVPSPPGPVPTPMQSPEHEQSHAHELEQEHEHEHEHEQKHDHDHEELDLKKVRKSSSTCTYAPSDAVWAVPLLLYLAMWL